MNNIRRKILKNNSRKFYLALTIVAAIIAALSLSIYRDKTNNQPPASTQIPVIDKKADTPTTSPSNVDTQPNANGIEITVSAGKQDTPGGPLVVRTILSSEDEGTCKYDISKNSVVKTYTSNIVYSGNYYSCNYNIPFGDLAPGEWQYKISVIAGQKTGSISGNVTIHE